MKKTFVLFTIALFSFLACNQGNSSAKNKGSIMYESKPLALLMLDMYDESALWKEAILADSFDIEIPVDFYGIYSVESTDRAVRNDVFMAQADAYLKAVKDLVEMSKEKQQVKKFNSTIDACVSCHQVFCQGPIDKIKHLYIEE